MAEITLSALQNALKRYYPEKEITSQFYDMTPLMAELEKQTSKVENVGDTLTAYVPIMLRPNASAGAVSESGVIPVGRTPQYLQLQVGVKYLYGTVNNFAAYVSNCIRNIILKTVKPFIEGNTVRTYGRDICLV